MGKDKLRRFAENLTFECMIQPDFEEIFHRDHPLKGHWREKFFGNDHPIVLELGCGRGEYTIALAQRDPGRNYIGVDIKGARMWRGAKTATEHQMRNVAFVRTRIEFIGLVLRRRRDRRDMDHVPRPAAQDPKSQKTSHVAALPRKLCTHAQTGGCNQSQDRFAASVRIHRRRGPQVRTPMRNLEPRHIRKRIRPMRFFRSRQPTNRCSSNVACRSHIPVFRLRAVAISRCSNGKAT